MAHYEYYSAIRTLVEASRSSHISLIERVCTEFGAPERSTELIGKYIDDSLRVKKFKDKRLPKRPKSGYMIYCEKRRSEVRESYPNASFAEVIKKMASEWNSLDADSKSKYTTLAEEDKGRYADEMEKYKAELYKTNVTQS